MGHVPSELPSLYGTPSNNSNHNVHYHTLIDALSAHMIYINLYAIVYTHIEHSPTETIYIKYYIEKKQNKKTIRAPRAATIQ